MRKAALQIMDYDRNFVVPNSSHPHAAMHPEKGRAAELPPLLGAFDAHTLEKICENTHPQPQLDLVPDF